VQGLPLSSHAGAVLAYILVLAATGLTITWAGTACNNPIMAEICPVHLRTLIYSFGAPSQAAACWPECMHASCERTWIFLMFVVFEAFLNAGKDTVYSSFGGLNQRRRRKATGQRRGWDMGSSHANAEYMRAACCQPRSPASLAHSVAVIVI
jgi:hypothetical protein